MNMLYTNPCFKWSAGEVSASKYTTNYVYSGENTNKMKMPRCSGTFHILQLAVLFMTGLTVGWATCSTLSLQRNATFLHGFFLEPRVRVT